MYNKRYLVYSGAAALCGVGAFLMAFFAKSVGLFYSVCIGVDAAMLGLTLARIAIHSFVAKDNCIKTWQINIYAVGVVFGWTIAILARTWNLTSVALCWMATNGIFFFGTRYLKDENEDGVSDVFQSKKVWMNKEWMVENLLYKPVDDKFGGKADKDRPLCKVEETGAIYTVAQAREQGLVELAEAGEKYIDSLLSK